MARLIDADALEYTRVRIFHGMNEDGTPCVGGWNAVVMSLAVREAPTIEAVPVVHGRWIEVRGRYICSNCRSRASLHSGGIGQNLSPFCPNCGAKMDGGDEHGSRKEL